MATNPAIGTYKASGVRGGRGDIGGRAEAYGAPADPTGTRGEVAAGATFNSMRSWSGRVFGETRSDQDIANDQAVSNALEEGRSTFTTARGRQASVAGYSRGRSPPTPGSLLDQVNQPPTVGGAVGLGVSTLIGGPLGFVAGRAARGVVNSQLGSRSILGGN
jgi:hypothetical protein